MLALTSSLLLLLGGAAPPVAAEPPASLGGSLILPNFYETGTLFTVAGISTASATGADMAGTEVRWTYADGTGGLAVWGAIGGGSCGINAGGLRFFAACDDNTFVDPWSLINTSGRTLTSLRLNGAPGRTVFDCGWLSGVGCTLDGTSIGTANSGTGRPVEFASGSIFNTPFVTFSNLVGVGGAPPVGDLFEQLLLEFDSFESGESLFLFIDSDSTDPFAPPPVQVVPEPGTMALLGAGLVGVAMAARRRRVA